jgi:hypothetical protein
MSAHNSAAQRPLPSEPTRLPHCGHSGGGTHLPVTPFSGGRKLFIKVRVSEAEREAIKKLADAEGGISAFLRLRLSLSGRQQAIREVARLARSLRLMARQTRGYPAGQAVELVSWLMDVDRQLDAAVQNLLKKLP